MKTDRKFMQRMRRKISKIFPDSEINQYQKNFSFRVRGTHGTVEQINDLQKLECQIKKMKTMYDEKPYIYILF